MHKRVNESQDETIPCTHDIYKAVRLYRQTGAAGFYHVYYETRVSRVYGLRFSGGEEPRTQESAADIDTSRPGQDSRQEMPLPTVFYGNSKSNTTNSKQQSRNFDKAAVAAW